MNFRSVDIDFLKYFFINEKMQDVEYNGEKKLELWTPIVYIKKTKDKYNNEYIQFNLEEYPEFLECIKIIDLHCMLNHDISQENRVLFKSSLFNDTLSCKIIKKRNIKQCSVTINKIPATIGDINFTDKASLLIFIDKVYTENGDISLKWKIKRCCVYRNDK